MTATRQARLIKRSATARIRPVPEEPLDPRYSEILVGIHPDSYSCNPRKHIPHKSWTWTGQFTWTGYMCVGGLIEPDDEIYIGAKEMHCDNQSPHPEHYYYLSSGTPYVDREYPLYYCHSSH